MMGIQAGENGERSDDRMADTILKGLSMKRKRGLIISQGQYIGWSITEPGEEFKKVIKGVGKRAGIKIHDGIMKGWQV